MAKEVEEVTLGFDVSKRHLEFMGSEPDAVGVIGNDPDAIDRFLDSFSGPVSIAVEATNVYHEQLVDRALGRGFTVYLIDGYRLNKYREAVGVRAKTDASDASLIHRYLISERAHLREVNPQNQRERRLWRILKRRAKLVKLRSQLDLSLRDLCLQIPEVDESLASLDRLIKRLTGLAHALADESGWRDALSRLRTIPGVGRLNALALTTMYYRGEFCGVDRFISFLGLDVRVRDSGTYRGRRKLTKKGDPEVRRLLFNGARAAAYRYPEWAEMKQRLMARGLSEIQTSVILARKIARISFALLKSDSVYRSEITCASS
ncbi:MAG: transposase [Gammaproteobacteria bacterium]|nr:MAG: transposase [Gammaproteobacteria bacterium]